ncbi:peptidase [Bacillus sp. AFS015802]|uniref:Type 1 glutamine amidotransferase-like domain-containing protein n=1 Tax=Bacillus sp. AFS015802 TaxID=2033486 RepID=UPI000BF43C88|nr:Type 1 glutamine amidotransferase-like domain-containing protein [Bacillus sp. AFS015802]PFA67691.1 peptidase [Bacillus sp. AFS015802]
MGGLYLSGGGDEKQSWGIDSVFARELGRGEPLLYLPIAMDQGEIPYVECYEWIQGVFAPFGITDITMWRNLRGKTLDDLKKFSAVYIGGGNTYRLMHSILQADFHSALSTFKEGGIIYGGSAGAIVLGSNIATCAHMDENAVELKTINGLGLIHDYSIWCHYTDDHDPLIHQFITANQQSVIALSEETGLQMKDGRMEVLGTSPAYVMDRDMKRRIEPGCII